MSGGHKPRWLILDNDAGVDDAVGLVLAGTFAAKYGVVVKALVASYGNANLDHVVRNNAKIREHMGPGAEAIPILPGHERPLLCKAGHAAFWHGADGLGDAKGIPDGQFPLPHDGKGPGSADTIGRISAVARKARATGHELIYCCVGPLTNLACAVRVDPKLAGLISRLVVMGCCGDAHGNDSLTGEFNILTDPDAASIVFQSFHNVEVVSWELTLKHSIPWPVFDAWRAKGHTYPSVDFLDRVLDHSYVQRRRSNAEHIDEDAAIICDAVAVAYALDPTLATKSARVWVGVELQGSLTRGQTVVDWGTSQATGKFGLPNCTWVLDMDQQRWEELFSRVGIFGGPDDADSRDDGGADAAPAAGSSDDTDGRSTSTGNGSAK